MLRAFALAAAIVPLLAACETPPAVAQMVTPEQRSTIDAACKQIMGLNKGEYYYAECEESLSRSLAGASEGTATARSYDACRGQGYAEGSAALSSCILEKRDAYEAQPLMASAGGRAAPLAYPQNDPDAGESYYNVTPRTHWRREQYSCAQLGLLPGTSAFTHCVADLDASLLPDLN